MKKEEKVIFMAKCPHCKKDIEIKLLKKKKGTGRGNFIAGGKTRLR